MWRKSDFAEIFGLVLLFGASLAASNEDLTPRQYLEQLLRVLPADRTVTPADQLPGTAPPRVSPEDSTWRDWVRRSGELPPDFDQLPSLPFLPDPLILDEGGENIPVETIEQWNQKREWIRREAQHWITGTVPSPPDNLEATVQSTEMHGQIEEQTVELRFGPNRKGTLHLNLMIPPGEGPFPVFICPWKKEREDWVQVALRRGYMGCRFTATDPKYGYPDDSEKFEELWWPEFDFSTLMRWGWGASRAVDYLYQLPMVDRERISLAGLSRNGKAVLWAGAYDNRFKAIACISGGTGGEDPFRYTTDKYRNETMELLTWYRPHWLHPRLRFFVGRESKLPVDQNLLMALVAPRGLIVSSAITESAGNPWGIEQGWRSARKAYRFLGVEDRILLHLRHGLHPPAARDLEEYFDFFDYVFGRGSHRPPDRLYYNYSFAEWIGHSGEMIDPLNYPVKGISDLLHTAEDSSIQSEAGWEEKKAEIRRRIEWGMGVEPPSMAPGPQPDYMRAVVGFPETPEGASSRAVGFGRLYFPSRGDGEPAGTAFPVVMYLHPYAYSQGFNQAGEIIEQFLTAGFAVYAFDQIGFGTRIEEGRRFYQRFPRWSKLGRMVADVRGAVTELESIDFLNPEKIYAVGYALGGTVGLYSASFDARIAGMISVAGFTPMRLDRPGKTAEGIFRYSHLHGLLPRLGFFVGNEARIPYDFHEILASIAPRPLLLVAPTWDQYASVSDVRECVEEVRAVYRIYGSEGSLSLETPEDYNRLSPETLERVVEWAQHRFQ